MLWKSWEKVAGTSSEDWLADQLTDWANWLTDTKWFHSYHVTILATTTNSCKLFSLIHRIADTITIHKPICRSHDFLMVQLSKTATTKYYIKSPITWTYTQNMWFHSMIYPLWRKHFTLQKRFLSVIMEITSSRASCNYNRIYGVELP
jgi:hypothetical protein